MTRAVCETSPKRRSSEAGFTLVEALTAIVILVFGLIAVTNLLIVAGNSSQVANAGTAAAALAVEQMELLKALPFVETPVGSGRPFLQPGGSVPPAAPVAGFFKDSTTDPRMKVPGVGAMNVRWRIDAIDPRTYYITVWAESEGALLRTRTTATFTSFRACTDPMANAGVCTNAPCCP